MRIKKEIEADLAATLLHQNFDVQTDEVMEADLTYFKDLARSYVLIDSNIAVLSDFKSDKSYIYIGSFGKLFNLEEGEIEVNSAFEECVFEKIQEDDLMDRHILELSYFNYLKDIDVLERHQYSTHCRMRILKPQGGFVYVNHRTLYLKSLTNGNVWLSLCLYSPSTNNKESLGIDSKILNSSSGVVLEFDKYKMFGKRILSSREIDVIQLVAEGLDSKEMAVKLHLSLHTIYRHRQNILRKLNVKNASEAIKVCIRFGIL